MEWVWITPFTRALKISLTAVIGAIFTGYISPSFLGAASKTSDHNTKTALLASHACNAGASIYLIKKDASSAAYNELRVYEMARARADCGMQPEVMEQLLKDKTLQL